MSSPFMNSLFGKYTTNPLGYSATCAVLFNRIKILQKMQCPPLNSHQYSLKEHVLLFQV